MRKSSQEASSYHSSQGFLEYYLPSLQSYVQVLKALTLVRLDKVADAMEITDALDVAGVHHDEFTLQAFVHCYRVFSNLFIFDE